MSSVKEKEKGGRVKSKPPIARAKAKRICFSFAAYANELLNSLKSSNMVIEKGLSEAELTNIESKLRFSFPADLRVILQQGLPVSQGFPNWRSSSTQQLQILLNLPAASILRRVAKTRFWHPSWGPQPSDITRAVRGLLNDAPPLVPIYRHCYIPSSTDGAGNPIFYIDQDGQVLLLSFDVAGFFREFLVRDSEEPVWAATAARRVRFWSEVAEARCGRWWWWGSAVEKGVAGCMDKAVWRLREGGWREEEIRDMMTLEENQNQKKHDSLNFKDKEGVAWHVTLLSLLLLRAGWSREDVVYSLGVLGDEAKSSGPPTHS
uniref:Knr4/Smi1-like domain-containing protein n=2 Tax=Cajanus cajan TaxID=3821 RepID=A0A151TJ81_CAJCA|nr:hypothetical protein KK1_013399 [Cajanus cajan]